MLDVFFVVKLVIWFCIVELEVVWERVERSFWCIKYLRVVCVFLRKWIWCLVLFFVCCVIFCWLRSIYCVFEGWLFVFRVFFIELDDLGVGGVWMGWGFCGWKIGVLVICVEGLFLNKMLIILVGCFFFFGIFSFKFCWFFSIMFGCLWVWIDIVLLWGLIWIFFIGLGVLWMWWNWVGVCMCVSNCCIWLCCWLIFCCWLMVVVFWLCICFKIIIMWIIINLRWGWFKDILK